MCQGCLSCQTRLGDVDKVSIFKSIQVPFSGALSGVCLNCGCMAGLQRCLAASSGDVPTGAASHSTHSGGSFEVYKQLVRPTNYTAATWSSTRVSLPGLITALNSARMKGSSCVNTRLPGGEHYDRIKGNNPTQANRDCAVQVAQEPGGNFHS